MTLSDIKNRIYLFTSTNSTSFPAADVLIALNAAMSRVTSLILQADGRWQWDDDNQSDLPISTTALVSGQQDYSFPVSYLKILRVEIKGNGGTYFIKLVPRDQEDPMWGMELQGLDSTTSGLPFNYDVIGHSIFLYPIPNYSQNASLKVYFQRSSTDFTSGDLSTGTLVPGFVSIFHDLLALWPSYDFAIANGLDNANQLFAEITRKETELLKYYAHRDPADRPSLSPRPIRYR